MNKRGVQRDASPTTEQDSRVYYYWLLVALFLEYARPESFIPFLRIPFVYSILPLSLFALSFFVKGFRPLTDVTKDPISKWMFIYVVLIAFSFTYAILGESAFNTFKLAFGFCTLAVLIIRLTTNEERMFGVIGAVAAAHLFLLVMNPQLLSNPEVRNYIKGAPFLGDGNDFSLSLCILVPCFIEFGLSAKVFWRKALGWVGALVLLFAIIATQSRGATLGIGAAAIYLWLKSPRKMATLALIAVGAGAALLYAPSNYFSRMSTITDYHNEASAQSRIDIWKAGTRMALDNPIFGVGAGNFPVAYGMKYKSPEEYAWKNAHSAYFQVWGELGTLGLITFLMLVLGNLWRSSRLRTAILARAGPQPDTPSVVYARRLYLLNASMLGYAVAGAFLSSAYYPHIFVVTGIFIAMRNIAESATGVNLQAVGAMPRRSVTKGLRAESVSDDRKRS